MAPSASAASSPSSSLASHVATVHPSAEQIKRERRQTIDREDDGARAGLRQERARRGLVLERGLGHPHAARCDAPPARRGGRAADDDARLDACPPHAPSGAPAAAGARATRHKSTTRCAVPRGRPAQLK